MADTYVQFSEVIGDLTDEEKAWVEKLPEPYFLQQHNEKRRDYPRRKAAAKKRIMSRFPAIEEDSWDEFPSFKWKVTEAPDGTQEYRWWIYSDTNGLPDHVAAAVQSFLKKFRPKKVFTLTWAETCEELKHGAFGGGWIAVSARSIQRSNSWERAENDVHGLVNDIVFNDPDRDKR